MNTPNLKTALARLTLEEKAVVERAILLASYSNVKYSMSAGAKLAILAGLCLATAGGYIAGMLM